MWAGGEGGRIERLGQMEWLKTEVAGSYLKRWDFSVHLAVGKRWHSHTYSQTYDEEIRQTHQSSALFFFFCFLFFLYTVVFQGISAYIYIYMCVCVKTGYHLCPSHTDLYEIWPTALEVAGSNWDQRKASVGQWGNGLPSPYHRVPFNKGTICLYAFNILPQWHTQFRVKNAQRI